MSFSLAAALLSLSTHAGLMQPATSQLDRLLAPVNLLLTAEESVPLGLADDTIPVSEQATDDAADDHAGTQDLNFEPAEDL